MIEKVSLAIRRPTKEQFTYVETPIESTVEKLGCMSSIP